MSTHLTSKLSRCWRLITSTKSCVACVGVCWGLGVYLWGNERPKRIFYRNTETSFGGLRNIRPKHRKYHRNTEKPPKQSVSLKYAHFGQKNVFLLIYRYIIIHLKIFWVALDAITQQQLSFCDEMTFSTSASSGSGVDPQNRAS